eukprot:TRINITY_DN56330_c0_g1_i1.p1 TRINITY_DN56330_c0_g1~~TRINITY_DN56330_c0_g1_i1.p1  ORF type:complete len:338 (-),score=47.60 TRINITY_DN56330_c0_g1_i1:48-1028(-)
MCTPACRSGPGPSGAERGVWDDEPFSACREDVKVSFKGREYSGRLVSEAGAPPRPLVVVIHNFQGLKLFEERVAEFMARVGYVGLAIDLYGDAVPPERRPWPADEADVTPYLSMCFSEHFKTQSDWAGTRQLLKSWLDAGLAQSAVDARCLPVLIGYCYGGGACLEAIRGGLPVAGISSLHGVPGNPEYKHNPNLNDAFFEKYGLKDLVAELSSQWQPPVNSYNTSAFVLVENGVDDDCVPASMLQNLVAEFNNAGVDFVLHNHAGAPHGFTLPQSLGPPGKLLERADRRSTESFLAMCREVWPDVPQRFVARNAAGTFLTKRSAT